MPLRHDDDHDELIRLGERMVGIAEKQANLAKEMREHAQKQTTEAARQAQEMVALRQQIIDQPERRQKNTRANIATVIAVASFLWAIFQWFVKP